MQGKSRLECSSCASGDRSRYQSELPRPCFPMARAGCRIWRVRKPSGL